MVISYYLHMISSANTPSKTTAKFDIDRYYRNILDIAPRSSGKNLCRICLREGSIPIHDNRDIAEALAAFANVKTSESKDYPKHLCEVCHKFLKGANVFRKRAKLTNKILKKSFNANNTTIPIKEEHVITVKIERLENDNYPDAGAIENDKYPDAYGTQNNEYTVANKEPTLPDNKDTQARPSRYNSNKKVVYPLKTQNVEDGATKNEPTVSEGEFDIRAKRAINNNKKACKICKKSFTRRYYNDHMSLHNTNHVNQHVCNICGRSFRLRNTLVSHIHIVHLSQDLYSRNKKITCSICNKPVNNRYLKKHIMTVHNPDHVAHIDHVCEICGKSFRSASGLKVHHLKYHNIKISLTDSPHQEFICDHCGKIYGQKFNLVTHIQKCHQPGTHGTLSDFKFKCQHCPYRAKELSTVKKHMIRHSGVKNHMCTECPSKFYYKHNLTKHMLSHKDRQVQCEACDRMFHTDKLMRKHYEAVHLGILKHVCNICGKAFGYKNKVRQHQRLVHKVERSDYGVKPLYLRVQENQNQSSEPTSQK